MRVGLRIDSALTSVTIHLPFCNPKPVRSAEACYPDSQCPVAQAVKFFNIHAQVAFVAMWEMPTARAA